MRAIAGDERTVPERAVLALVNRRQRDIALPTIEVQSNASETALRTLRFSEPPIRVLRWTAHNRTARDFRYSCGVRYTPAPLEANRGEFRLNAPAQGWEATFIEAEFSDGYIATSPVFITLTIATRSPHRRAMARRVKPYRVEGWGGLSP